MAYAVLKNVTVDDNFQDPLTGQYIQYAPENAWRSGPECKECAELNTSMIHNQTWHESTFCPANDTVTASFIFNGSAIYVYCIIFPPVESNTPPGRMTELEVYIDDSVHGTQFQTWTNDPNDNATQYNVLVYNNSLLNPGLHHFTLQNAGWDQYESIVLFDYLIYSYDDGTSPSAATATASSTSSGGIPESSAASPNPNPSVKTSGRSPAAPIAGGVAGGVVLFAILGLILFFRRRRRSRAEVNKTIPQPYVPQNGITNIDSNAPMLAARYQKEPVSSRAADVTSNRQSPLQPAPESVTDAGAVSREGESLPPEYGQIFVTSNSPTAIWL